MTYGTFCPRPDGELFPSRDRMKLDFAAISEAGFTVVRTYTEPGDDVLGLAADWDLRLLAGVYYPDWRYLVGCSRRQFARVAREARTVVAAAARRLSHHDGVLGLVLGNEIPADVVRWVGQNRVSRLIGELADVVRNEDPARLVTYANYPTTEYLDLSTVDFLTFNVFLEDTEDFRRYLNRLHQMAGERPLVLGEIGLDAAAGEAGQAKTIVSQLQAARERGVAGTCVFSWTDEWGVAGRPVEGWRFGLTDELRHPKASLEAVVRFNRTSLPDLKDRWPSISVVVCAHNAESTLAECLEHLCALDYPGLEAIVVDDGSTDATAEIARRFPVKLVSCEWGGLSVARNTGCETATGEIVAYLDADAYPSPEWPWYMALGFDRPEVVGVGGPNVPPPHCGTVAQQVARAPGGPVHVLLTDDRAEHVPGCNMAFWRDTLLEVGAFNPVYTAAGDDVDLCWRVLDGGGEIAFHPGALVWHHPRVSRRGYLKQQRGYGKAEALVAARHPNRFSSLGTARWCGFLYDSLNTRLLGQRIYRGMYGAALFQSIYRTANHRLDVAHQLGVPLALLLLVTGPLSTAAGGGLLPLVAAGFVAALGAVDMFEVTPPRGLRQGRLRFRMGVASLHLLQPVVRAWGRLRHSASAGRKLDLDPLPDALPAGPTLLVFPADRPREHLVATLAGHLRRAGVKVASATGWEPYDICLRGSTAMVGELTTSAFPEGSIQLRIRRRLRGRVVATFAGFAGLSVRWVPGMTIALGAVLALEVLRGWVRIPAVVRRVAGATSR